MPPPPKMFHRYAPDSSSSNFSIRLLKCIDLFSRSRNLQFLNSFCGITFAVYLKCVLIIRTGESLKQHAIIFRTPRPILWLDNKIITDQNCMYQIYENVSAINLTKCQWPQTCDWNGTLFIRRCLNTLNNNYSIL